MAIPAGKIDPSLSTKGRIVDATLALVFEVGLSEISHRKIAERGKLPLGSTTYHFDTLGEIVAAAVEKMFLDEQARRHAILETLDKEDEFFEVFLDLCIPSDVRNQQNLSLVYSRLFEIQADQSLRSLIAADELALQNDIAIALEFFGFNKDLASEAQALFDGFVLQWLIHEKSWNWFKTKLKTSLEERHLV
jgi:DNA-binding transcriptional regulator YbjK